MGITPADLERMEYMEERSEEIYQRDLIILDARFNLRLILDKDIFDYGDSKKIYEVYTILDNYFK